MDSNSSEKIRIKIDPDLADLIPDYLKRREADVQGILSALKNNDFDRIRTIGHQMKGSGTGYGFIAITEIGLEIENEAVAKSSTKLPELSAKLADYLKRLEVVFE